MELKTKHADFQEIFQDYLRDILVYLNEPWMIWVYGVLIILCWGGTILLGYYFRRSLALFVTTVTVSYLLIGVFSIMMYRISANPQIAGQPDPDIFPDSGDQVTVYHHHPNGTVTPTPTPAPEPK